MFAATGLKQETVMDWGAWLQRMLYSGSMQSPHWDRSCWSSPSNLQHQSSDRYMTHTPYHMTLAIDSTHFLASLVSLLITIKGFVKLSTVGGTKPG